MGSENSKAAKASGQGSSLDTVVTVTTRQGDAVSNGSASRNIGLAPAIKVGNSASCNDNLLGAGLPQQTDTKLTIDNSRSRSSSASTSNKQAKKPTLTQKSRQLIQSCFQNPHENLGRRILKRTAEKRKDFGKFYMGLNSEQRDDVEETIKTFLKKSVANVEFMDEVQRLAEEFGERFVPYRSLGFKADYFASVADATITECVFLDNAVHPAHMTLSAFSQFITALFSSVRDGFYNEMKRLRRTSNSFSTGSNGSARREKKASIDSSREATPSPRSGTPEVESPNNSSSSSPPSTTTPEQPIHLEQQPTQENDNNNENILEAEPVQLSKSLEEGLPNPGNSVCLTNADIQDAVQETFLEENAMEQVRKTIFDFPKEVVDKVIIDTTNKVIIDSTSGPREAVQKVIIDSIIVDSVTPQVTTGLQ